MEQRKSAQLGETNKSRKQCQRKLNLSASRGTLDSKKIEWHTRNIKMHMKELKAKQKRRMVENWDGHFVRQQRYQDVSL